MDNKRNCNSCKHGRFDNCETLKTNEEYKQIVEKTKGEIFNGERFAFKDEFICDNYKSRYIEYPLTMTGIDKDIELSCLGKHNIGKFVKIKPCKENKTYLGLFLGELPIDILVSHNEETKILNLSFMDNPAIFVFDLKKIIYGCESWWSVIENEDDLKEITNTDINNQWYIKALQSLNTEKGQTDEK